jgi:hypothetical protein
VRQFRRDYDFLRGAQFVPNLAPALRRLKLYWRIWVEIL